MPDEPEGEDEEGMTQYEQERKARIASNRRLMQSLGLDDAADAARGAAAAQKRRREGRAEGGARRRSTRGLEQSARTLKSEEEEDSVDTSRDGAASQGFGNIVGRHSAEILLEQSARKFLESEEDEDSVAASRDSAVSTSVKAHSAAGAARRPRVVQPWLPVDDDTSFLAKEDAPKCKQAAKMSHRLNGKQIFFTGALQMKRYDAKTKAEAAGATVTDSASADIDILVCGSWAVANKKKFYEDQKKAFPGIEVWTETQFTSALSGGGSSNGKKRAAASFGFAAAKAAKKTKASEEESNTSMREAKMSLSPPPPPPPKTKGSEQESAPTSHGLSCLRPPRPLMFADAARAAGSSTDFARRVLQVVKAIPVGRVASYGQCAALAGRPNNARQVGKLLALGLAAGGDVPVDSEKFSV